MAVAFVSDSEITNGSASSVGTLTSVPGSTGNALAIFVFWEKVTNAAVVSSVTYGGNACTHVVTAGGDNRFVALYRYENPAGTESVVATLSANSDRLGVHAVVLSGVNTASPIGDSDSAQASGTSSTLTLTTATGDLLVDGCARVGSEAATVGANQTERYTFASGGASLIFKASTQAGDDGGAMSWSWTSTLDFGHVAANFSGGGAAVKARRAMLMGVG